MKEQVFNIIDNECKKFKTQLKLIASENYSSADVRKALGSCLTDKYAEGYPKGRYYGGCENSDQIENMAISGLKKIFGARFSNVQPHSGSQANQAVYFALLNSGDKILSLSLDSGGHLSHGHKNITFAGKYFKIFNYSLNKESNLLDYDEIEKLALKIKPSLIICGYSAYPRIVDFKRFSKIAKKSKSLLMSDIAHIAGLVAAGLHQNPIKFCDVVTSTTHKTLRGPRGGIIMTNNFKIIEKINKSVFPGIQGGPQVNSIAAKAIAFHEANTKKYSDYQKQVLENSRVMAAYFVSKNVDVLTKGTDNHMIIIDVKKSFSIIGKDAEEFLEKAGIIVNKNSIPFDSLPPQKSSGIRIGTPAMTTLGFQGNDFLEVAKLIYEILENKSLKYSKQRSKDVETLVKKVLKKNEKLKNYWPSSN